MAVEMSRQAKRQAKAQWIFVGCGLLGAAGGAGHALMEDMNIVLPRGLMFVGALAVVVSLFAASVVYWRNIDEAAREAHKFAWFWGGTGGLLALPAIATLVTSERLVAVLGQREPGEWVAFGFMSLLTAQILGYGLVWVGWWLRQR